MTVTAIPDGRVKSGFLFLVKEQIDKLAGDVVDDQSRLRSLRQTEPDGRARVEGVGVVLQQSMPGERMILRLFGIRCRDVNGIQYTLAEVVISSACGCFQFQGTNHVEIIPIYRRRIDKESIRDHSRRQA